VVLVAAVLSALAVGVLLTRPGDGRLRRALPERTEEEVPRAGLSASTAACLLAGAAVGLLFPGPSGVLVGLGLAVAGPRLLGRLEPAATRRQRERLVEDLPLVLDLLAACLVGGAAMPAAATAVSVAVPGPAGLRLAAVSAALAAGFAPAQAWSALGGPDPESRDDPLAGAARTLSRAAEGGAPVAAAVSRLAADARADARARGEQAARRVGVLAVAPLGLCFLPAFVLLGVVPVIAGLAGPLFATL
jgi:pilus assembly protein TadC